MAAKAADYQHAESQHAQQVTDYSMDNRRRRQIPSHENPSMQYNIITGTMSAKVQNEKPKYSFREQLPPSTVSQPPYATY